MQDFGVLALTDYPIFTILLQPRHIFAKSIVYNKIKQHKEESKMKRTIAYATIAMLVLLIAASLVYAATPEQVAPPAGPHRQHITLTDAQKQELAPLQNQMLEIRKQMTQKYVDWGYITQEQADERNARMQDRMNKMQSGDRNWKGHGRTGRAPCQQQQTPAANQ
jgi:hypothetical protein